MTNRVLLYSTIISFQACRSMTLYTLKTEPHIILISLVNNIKIGVAKKKWDSYLAWKEPFNIRITWRVISKDRHITYTSIFTRRLCSVCRENTNTFYVHLYRTRQPPFDFHKYSWKDYHIFCILISVWFLLSNVFKISHEWFWFWLFITELYNRCMFL